MSYLADLERKYVAALDEIKSLQDQVAGLNKVIADLTVTEIPQVLRLTRQEESVFKVLMARAECTKVQLLEAAWPAKVGMADEPDIKIVDVFICKLRKKIGPHGITISTRFGHGYSMPPESKAAVARFLDAAIAAERRRAGG